MIKKQRWIPSGMVEFKPELGDYPKDMFQCFVNLENKTSMFFTGKQTNHTWYNRFSSEEDMKKKIKDSISGIMSREERKEKRKEERKESKHSLKEGDILYSSWGYDQTNIDFYQVTKVVSEKSVEIREINSETTDYTDYGTQYVIPVKDSFLTPRGEWDKTGLPIIKRPSSDNTISLSNYESCWLWDGKPKSKTSVGWGH